MQKKVFMSKINWNSINWRAFETLVSILILSKDIEAKTYNRLGTDAGIDIKSGDGKTVYQVKYTTNQEGFSTVINEAKKELQKIKTYKNPSHKNFQYWDGVEKWCLITNALYNPADNSNWEEEVEKPFLQFVGLKAVFIDGINLTKELIQFPALKEEYFNGDNRVLLSLPEAIDNKKSDVIFFKGFNPKFIEGRSKELDDFSKFIKEDYKKIILIHGSGGIGKTRFAIEVAIQANKIEGYDVFWANTATMEKSNNWFQSIVPGRKTLLIIDEPREKQTVDILLEQIASQRISDWKFAIITRSAKDHILESLNYKKINIIANPIELTALNKEMTKKVTLSLINDSDELQNLTSSNNIRTWESYISKISDGFPIWIVVAIKLLEDTKNINKLPQDTYGLAKKYLEECLSSLLHDWERNKLYEILKSIAILQPINIEDDPQLYDNYFKPLLKNVTKSDLENIFTMLQEKKLAGKRGRLLEIKPDVIRDYIILKLIGENKEESKEWVEKILSMKGTGKKKSALKQLARIAFDHKLKGETNIFLDSTWDIFIQKAKTSSLKELKGMFDDQQPDTGVFDLADSISFSNLPKFINFVQAIRSNKMEKEPIKFPWGEVIYIHLNDIILDLPWALYKAGEYVSSDEEVRQIFKELLYLAEKEHPLVKEKPFPYNEGSRAVRLIERLMPKGQFSQNVDVVSSWIIKRLDVMNDLNEDQMAVLNFLIKECFFKLETHISEYIDGMIASQQVIFSPESKYNKCRNEIFKKIWSILNSGEAELQHRKYLWILLNTYHSQLNYISNRDKNKTSWEQELKSHFNLIKKYLSKNNIGISEVEPLRNILDWHLKYDKRDNFKLLAEKCEKLIPNNNKIDREFESLFDYDSFESMEKRFQKYTKQLNSENKILSFIEKVFNYSSNKFNHVSGNIANNLGCYKILPDYILNYIQTVIKNNKCDHHFQFVCDILLCQSGFLRKNHEETLFSFLIDYWNQIKSIKGKEIFLNTMYHPVLTLKWKVRKEDIQFIIEIFNQSKTEFSENCLYTISYFAGNILFLDFNQSKDIIETILQQTDFKKRNVVFKRYIEGANDRYISSPNYKVAFPDQPTFKPKKDMFPWLINLLQHIPSIDFGNIHHGTGLEKIKADLKGKFSVIDFVEFVKKRLSLLEEKNDSSWKNIFFSNDFLKIVDPVGTTDVVSKDIKVALNDLLNFNNHKDLYYVLPDIAAKLDPEGFLIPSMIVERTKEKVFLCEKLEDTPSEYEWTRYAGYYFVNSKPWRIIAKVACDIAIQETETKNEKRSLFSSLLSHKIEVFSAHYGEVSPHFYNKVERAQSDLNNESDSEIKEFMRWRWEVAKKDLEKEKLKNTEEHHD